MNFPPLNTWQRKLHEPEPKSSIHKCSRPPCIEVVNLLPIAYRVSNYINEEKRNERNPIFDLSGIALEPPKPGPHGGVPLGGLGSGSIGRGFKGEFRRWSLRPGRYIHRVISSDVFCIRVKRGDDVYAKVLSVTQPSADGGADNNNTMTSTLNSWDWSLASSTYCGGTFYGLHPRSWTVYENPVPDTTVIVKQVSPFIPHSYSEASLPCTAFIIEVINTHPSLGIEASVMFCFENGYRDEQEMQRTHVNTYFHIDAQSKSKISHEYQDKSSHEDSNVCKNKDISMTTTGVSIEGICMTQQQQREAKQMQRKDRFNSYSIASTCSSIDQLFSLFSETTTDHHTPQATSSATTTSSTTTTTTGISSESSSPSDHDGNNDSNLKSANAVMSTSLSYCESFITSYSTVDKGQELHLIDRLSSFLFGFNMPITDQHHLNHHTNHERYGYSANKLWEGFKLNGTISNIDDDDDDNKYNYTGDNIKADELNNSFCGNEHHHCDDEGNSDSSSKGDIEDDSLNHDSCSRSKPSHRIYDGGEGTSSITIGSAVCLKKWIQPVVLSSTTTFHEGQTNPIMKDDDKTSYRDDTSTANSAVFPFALAWDNPYVAFGRMSSTTSSSNNSSSSSSSSSSNSSSTCGSSCGSDDVTGDGDCGMNEVPRYYTRFFGCSGLSSSKIASWALMKCSDWDRQIDKWQQEMIYINPSFNNDNCNSPTKRKNNDNNRTTIDDTKRSVNDVSCARDRSDDDDPIKNGNINIPCSSIGSSSGGGSSSSSSDGSSRSSSSFYNSQLFNELYYLVDGGSIWTDTQRGKIV